CFQHTWAFNRPLTCERLAPRCARSIRLPFSTKASDPAMHAGSEGTDIAQPQVLSEQPKIGQSLFEADAMV
ncbi:MAG TPA: hypothetical protein VF510_18170, partial [Ktedonobacterales bacterium]